MSHWIHWCWWRFEGLDPGHHNPHHFWRDLRGVTVKQFLQRFKSDSVTFTAPSRSDRSYVRGPDLLSQALYSLLLETNAIPQMPSRKICLPALCDITPSSPHHRVWPFGTATITFCNFFCHMTHHMNQFVASTSRPEVSHDGPNCQFRLCVLVSHCTFETERISR